MKKFEKKKSIILLIFLATTVYICAQVGVNTQNPQGIFHIDGKGDTNGSANLTDDVIVTPDGNIGIGTNSPTTKLDIRTTTATKGFRLVDGTQGNGKVLLSNISGSASWGNLSPGAVSGVKATANITLSKAPTYKYLGMNIVVPPGKSQVYAGGMVRGADMLGYITTSLSTSSSSITLSGITQHPGLAGFGIHTGTTVGQVIFFVDNTTSSSRTLYLWGTIGGGPSSATWILSGVAEPFIFVAY